MVIRTRTIELERKPRAFDQIAEGLNEAIAVAKGKAEPHRIITAAQEVSAISKSEAEPANVHAPKRRPNGDAKKLITLRLDPEVIEAFKAKGKGWQALMNDALRRAAGL